MTNCCTMLMQPNTNMNNWYLVGMPYQYTTICVGLLSCSSVFLSWHICLQSFYLWKPLKLALLLGSGSRNTHAPAPLWSNCSLAPKAIGIQDMLLELDSLRCSLIKKHPGSKIS